jgi:hypothetical protein
MTYLWRRPPQEELISKLENFVPGRAMQSVYLNDSGNKFDRSTSGDVRLERERVHERDVPHVQIV